MQQEREQVPWTPGPLMMTLNSWPPVPPRAALVPRRWSVRSAGDSARIWRRVSRASIARDSLAFDFHKWGQVPGDRRIILVRDGVLHRNTFAASPPYLRKELRGLAAGALAVRFRTGSFTRFSALKTRFTFSSGAEALGSAISHTCALARYMERRIAETR